MTQKEILITQFDAVRLEKLLKVVEGFGDQKTHRVGKLREVLDRATIVSPKEVPRNVVTMNSKVLFRDVDMSAEMTYTLVFPKDANIAKGSISVLSPIGTAILGYREGDAIEWQVPAGRIRISIEKILYQPEAAGNFDL
jgi:regulator of nucleoside diphosphate kinase